MTHRQSQKARRAYQAALLNGILESDYADGGDFTSVWTWSACDGIPEASRGGVVARAAAAGLVRCDGEGKDATIRLTQKGLDAIRAVRS